MFSLRVWIFPLLLSALSVRSASAAETLPTEAPRLVLPFTMSQAKSGQEAWAKSLAKPVLEKNALGMELVLIPPGQFTMGSPPTENDRDDNEAQVPVTLTKAFWLSTTEVTQSQWTQVMGTTPWRGKDYVTEGPDYAASYVSWNEAQEFIRKLSVREGVTYRLPTEAEWEWSCRAGTSSSWNFGEQDHLAKFGWYGGANGGSVELEQYAHPVGQKPANPFGLYDMHGNVWEWCEDVLIAKLPGAINPQVRTGTPYRVLRGGSWSSEIPSEARSANRSGFTPDSRFNDTGVRVSRTP